MPLLPKGKFGRDVLWNMGAFGVQGVSGLALNVLIGRFYGPAPLGLFNQVFALYIFFSQLAVFGLHFSALRHVAEHRDDPSQAGPAAVSALLLTMAAATLVTAASFLGAPLLSRAWRSPDFGPAWLAVLPGLWCFALNKTLLAVINAHSHMRAFAVAQAARYLLLLAALGWWVVRGLPGELLAGIISASEIVLTLGLVAYAPAVLGLPRLAGCGPWLRRHLDFGARSFLSGAVIELNSRVDVILLGFYVDDAAIGVYSLAALFIEGLAQVYVVLRNVINPMITRFVTQNRFDELARLRDRLVKATWLVSIPVGVVAMVLYPLVLPPLAKDPAFVASVPVFALLMAGLILSAGYQPFAMALLQSGFPGLQTVYMGLILAANVVGNAVLIPALGIDGAGAATGASFVCGVFFLKWLYRRRTGFAL